MAATWRDRFRERPERDAVAVREAPAAEHRRAVVDASGRTRPTSRDFPTPASPTIVTRRDAVVVDGLVRTRRRGRRSSSSRPTIGASSRRGRSASSWTDDEPIRRNALRLALELERLDGLRRRRSRARGDTSGRRAGSRCAPAACSSRAATLTVSPVTSRWPVDGSPATTSPVFTPVRTVSRTPQLPLELVVQHVLRAPACPRRRAPRAARRPRGASGSPKTAMIASPMNFSTTPPWRSSSARIASK